MLTYTVDARGCKSIGPCVGGVVRLSIISICQREGWEIPLETFDEATPTDTLRELNLDLLIRRARLRQTLPVAAIRPAPVEPSLPPELAERVAELRRQADRLRDSAQHAERSEAMRRELSEAADLERQAAALIASYAGDRAEP